MSEYSLQKENFKIVLRKAFLYSFMSLLLPLILYFILKSSVDDYMIQGVFKLFCGLFFVYTLIKESLRIYRIRRDWLSFKILITEDAIHKKQYKTEDTIIPTNKIVKIVQVADGVSIQSEEANKFLYIPKNIENYEEVLSKLNSLKPIEVSSLMSLRIPSEYTIQQHIKHGSALKRLFLAIGVVLGVLLILFLLLIILLL
jgi:hypothetical protein